MNSITIELFRISRDSKYLDLKFSCPRWYYFTNLQISAKILKDGKFEDVQWELGEYLFTKEVEKEGEIVKEYIKDQIDWTVRIPLDEALDVKDPGIYYATFLAAFDWDLWKEDNPEWETYCEVDLPTGEPLEATATTSDVNFAYRCMLDDLMHDSGTCGCPQVSDEAIRKYLILYGHQAALTTGDTEVAEVYFRLLNNCFNKCGAPERRGEPHKGCGCRR